MRKDPLILQVQWIWAVVAILLAAGWKTWLAAGGIVPFNADEAIVSLMARHILQGSPPVFFYGQSYMGSLDAFLIALVFRVFGEAVWVIRLVQGLLYLALLLSTGWLGRLGYGSWTVGVTAMLLLAVPPVNVSLYTSVSQGGYGETLLTGNLLLLLGISLYQEWNKKGFPGSLWKWLLAGLLSGYGLWVFGLSLIYSAAFVLFLAAAAWRLRTSQVVHQPTSAPTVSFSLVRLLPVLSILVFGAVLGSSPWWLYALQHGLGSLVGELGGGAVAGVEHMPWLEQTWAHIVNLVLLGSSVTLGFRPTSSVTWLALPLLPFVLFFWIWVIQRTLASLRSPGNHRPLHIILLSTAALLLAGFVLTPFGVDPSGRYFLPLAVPLALWAGWAISGLRQKAGRWAYALVGLVLLYNAWGTIECALRFPPGITTQFYEPTHIDHRFDAELVEFLLQNGEVSGYTHYWVAYPLAFLSQERLIFVPHLPYHADFRYTRRDDRYQPYTALVAQAQKAAYITTRQPELQAYLREQFALIDVAWKEKQIGDYRIFYQLSRLVRPDEMGLGSTSQP